MTGAPKGASWCAALLLAACDAGGSAPVLDLPARPGDAPGGAEIARDVRDLDLEAREERIFREVARGNVPGWLRRLQRVELTGEVGGRERRVTFWVTPDYLAVGSDEDFLRIPLSPRTARRIADLAGGSLPTPRMVDAVWESARVRLAPIRLHPDEHMSTVRYFERHDQLVGAQRWLRGVPPGVFVAGHKVDVVLPATPSAGPAGGAVYGWHRPGGEPIQPLHRLPGRSRVPYSRGIRLVHRAVLVDGAPMELAAVLRDPGLAPLLSGGGTRGSGRR